MASRLVVVAAVLVALSSSAEPLLGQSVGNADTFVSEGVKLFNRKSYQKAAEEFLKATRANPANTAVYVQLARAQMLAREPVKACYAYRIFLKVTPETPDRKKAAAEAEQCERQAKATKEQSDLLQKYVDSRAAFFSSLDKGELLGAGGAASSLEALVKDGFLGPELGDMGTKLGAAATSQADAIHKRALAGERLTSEQLKLARPLYQVAQDVSSTSPDSRGRMAFLDGLAELSEKNYRKAELHFTEAAKSDPTNMEPNKEYVFYRALAIFQGGDRAQALKVLEGSLKDDPRTAMLRAALAVGHSSDSGAAELEKLLFSTRNPPEKQ
jgi:tetratricopeptide (TPR) repeat protein